MSRRSRAWLACVVLFAAPVAARAGAGDLDPSFAGDGTVVTDLGSPPPAQDLAYAGAIAPDGKIIAAGSSNGPLALARYNTDGSLDSTFDGDGKVVLTQASVAYGVAVQSDGKIVAAGVSGSGSGDFAVTRLNVNGTPDASFAGSGTKTTDLSSGGQDTALDVAIQPDGKIVAVGQVNNTTPNIDVGVARYNADGSPDTTFGGGTGWVRTDVSGSFDSGEGVALQPDGKIVVGATIGTDFAVLRYNANGSLDTSFGGGDGIATTSFGGSQSALAVGLQPDGKILVTGQVNQGGTSDIGVARFNSDGTLDVSFGGTGKVVTNAGSLDAGTGVEVQSDGRIVVGGSGAGGFTVVRYEADGSLDDSFGTGGIASTSFGGAATGGSAVAIQADGRIVVFGIVSNADFGVARFLGEGLDHFACYVAKATPGSVPFAGATVGLLDQFGGSTAELLKGTRLCAPADKNGENPGAPLHVEHLEGYRLRRDGGFTQILNQRVDDQFGTVFVDLKKPSHLLVPTAKSHVAFPAALDPAATDHFQCYKVKDRRTPPFATVTGVALEDQFGPFEADVKKPRYLCAPVDKNGETPGAETHRDHLMCYRTRSPGFIRQSPLFVRTQFGPETLDAVRHAELCVPAATNLPACERITVIPASGGVFTGGTGGVSSLAGTCNGGGAGAPEVVFQWTPTTSGTATIETCGTGTDFDTLIYFRSGSCASGTETACNDDACANASGLQRASRITPTVTAGQTYFIVVDGFVSSSGTFSLSVQPAP